MRVRLSRRAFIGLGAWAWIDSFGRAGRKQVVRWPQAVFRALERRSDAQAIYSNTAFKNVGSEAGVATPAANVGGTARFNNAELNFKYQFTPSWLVGAAYDYTKGYGIHDATYQQGVLGTIYLISKRTDVYADVMYQHASGTDSTGASAVANLNGLTASTTPNQVLGIVGMRHRF